MTAKDSSFHRVIVMIRTSDWKSIGSVEISFIASGNYRFDAIRLSPQPNGCL